MACTKMAVDKPSVMTDPTSQDPANLEPIDVLTFGYNSSLQIRGSSTACVVLLHPLENKIRYAVTFQTHFKTSVPSFR
jgi:hypothetical protein